MQRRTCIHLAGLAAAMGLLAGAIRPAAAQGPSKAPSYVQAFPNAGAALVTWGAVLGATSYNLYRYEMGQTPEKAMRANLQPNTLTWFIDLGPEGKGLPNGKPLFYSVKAVLQDGSEGPASPTATVTPQEPVLGGFFYHTIGTLNPGSVTVADNVLTIRGSGADIWDDQDDQTFLAVPVAGDYMITAKLLEKPTIDAGDESDYGKIGLQIKYDLTKGAPYALIFASVNRDPEILYERRLGFLGGDPGNGGAGGTSLDETTFPVWLRLIKKENTIAALQSFDGKTFTGLGDPVDFGRMPLVTYVGITATAHKDGAYVIGKFDASSITIGPAP
jgi:hypothetical protein